MVWLGILLALVTSASWAVGNVLSQRLGKLVGAPRAMLWAMAAGGALSAPCALVLDTRQAPFTVSVALWLAAAAISGVVAYIGLFSVFANEKLTIAVPLVSSWPLVACVVSVVLLGETVQGVRTLGAAAVLAGVVLVSLVRPIDADPKDVSSSSSSTWSRSLLAALGASVGFGVMVPAMGLIAPALGVFGTTTIVFALGIALAARIGRLAGVSLRPPPRAAWGLVLATGAVETIGFLTAALARRFAPMTLVAPVASLSSTLTVLYAWLVLKERPRPLALAGALLSGIGVALLAA